MGASLPREDPGTPTPAPIAPPHSPGGGREISLSLESGSCLSIWASPRRHTGAPNGQTDTKRFALLLFRDLGTSYQAQRQLARQRDPQRENKSQKYTETRTDSMHIDTFRLTWSSAVRDAHAQRQPEAGASGQAAATPPAPRPPGGLRATPGPPRPHQKPAGGTVASQGFRGSRAGAPGPEREDERASGQKTGLRTVGGVRALRDGSGRT